MSDLHEPGDRNIQVHEADVVAACLEVGIEPGDVVMFHGSLSSMGDVVGGANTVIDGFLQAVGPAGTVCVPTLWWFVAEPPMLLKDWDIDTSPSYPGLITETFRQRPDSIRSNNPTHSVSAIGARAAEITADHGAAGLRACVYGDTAFAAVSPWQKLYDWNAAYCFIGVDFMYNTLGHFCQALYLERILQHCPVEKRAALDERISRWVEPDLQSCPVEKDAALDEQISHCEKIDVWPSFNFQAMGERLAEMGLVRFSKIGSATLRCIRTHDMVPNILQILETEPEAWFKFNEEFLKWLKAAREITDD